MLERTDPTLGDLRLRRPPPRGLKRSHRSFLAIPANMVISFVGWLQRPASLSHAPDSPVATEASPAVANELSGTCLALDSG
jgi:hypothetical protein